MRLVLLCLVAVVGLALGEWTVEDTSAFDYHARIGMKEAERIRNEEIQIFSQLAQSRIVGGAIASTSQHPHLAGLLIDFVGINGNSVCGSSILTTNRLLTAAHCWFDGNNQAWRFTAVMGNQFLFFGEGLRIPSSSVVSHPQWTPSNLGNDVAIIYMPENIPFGALMSPVSLPTGTAIWEDFNGNWANVAGYGRTSDSEGLTMNTMRSHVDLLVITNSLCQMSFGTVFVQPSTICTSGTGGVGICGGDSGGPLTVIRNGVPTLIGVCSFVAAAGCQLGHPSAYARVTSFLNFIYQHL